MRVNVCRALFFLFAAIGRMFCLGQEASDRLARRFNICPRCGRNVYTGAPCMTTEEV